MTLSADQPVGPHRGNQEVRARYSRRCCSATSDMRRQRARRRGVSSTVFRLRPNAYALARSSVRPNATAREPIADNPLIGTWQLVSWTNEASDGSTTHPIGSDAVGLIGYSADGHMFAHISTCMSINGSSVVEQF